jgi:hypothetical protein
MAFDVLCDNKASYQICARGGTYRRPVYGKPVLLVRCDRLDNEDNERGRKLAEMINDRLNQLSLAEQKEMLAEEMIPVNFGEW